MGNELSGQGKERTVIRRDRLRELRNQFDFRHLFRLPVWPRKAREDGFLEEILPRSPELDDRPFLINKY